jgi:hypothetical protein
LGYIPVHPFISLFPGLSAGRLLRSSSAENRVANKKAAEVLVYASH